MSAHTFDHEKLRVYQSALKFVAFADQTITQLSAKVSAKDQLERASTSIVLNIAEGNGKRSRVDRCRYLDIARGSALECAACLDVLAIKKMIAEEQAAEGKELLVGIVAMLIGLLETFGAQLQDCDQAPYEAGSVSVSPLDHD